MKFKLPTGFVLPDGVEAGEDFDAVITLTLDEDGGVSVVALDGSPIEGAEVVESDDDVDDEDLSAQAEADFLSAVSAEMGV